MEFEEPKWYEVSKYKLGEDRKRVKPYDQTLENEERGKMFKIESWVHKSPEIDRTGEKVS